MMPAVFLDRDNTIIHNDGDLGDPAEVRLIQGAAAAIASIRGLGYKVVVITNQGGVARGNYTEKDVDSVHEKISELVLASSGVRIDRYYYCPYHPKGSVEKYTCEHPWRKPQPGMLRQAAKDLDIDLSKSWTVGDQLRDVAAGEAAGTRTILLSDDEAIIPPLGEHGRFIEFPKVEIEPGQAVPDFVARNLVEAVRIIAQQRKPDAAPPAKGHRWKPVPLLSPQRETAEQAQPKKEAQRKEPPTEDLFSQREQAPSQKASAGRDVAVQAKPASPTVPKAVAMSVSKREAQPEPAQPAAQTQVIEPEKPEPPKSQAPPPPSPAREAQPIPREQGDENESPLLRQILQELRNQRAAAGDMSFPQIAAIALQAAAVVCLLAALLMGARDMEAFVRWLLIGLMVQLSVIAMLLFRR